MRFLLVTPSLQGTPPVLCKGGVTTDMPCGQMAAAGRSPLFLHAFTERTPEWALEWVPVCAHHGRFWKRLPRCTHGNKRATAGSLLPAAPWTDQPRTPNPRHPVLALSLPIWTRPRQAAERCFR